MGKLHISSTPHIHQKGSSTRNIMLDVTIAMLPATVAGIIIFGLKALWVVLTCVASAVLAAARERTDRSDDMSVCALRIY